MKKFRRIMALLIATVMVMSMSMAAFAAQTTTGSIDLTGGKSGHTYTLYQILKGKVDSESGELVDIQWGDDAPAALKTQYGTAAAAAKAIAEQNDARAFAQSLTLTGGTENALTADGNVTFSGLTAGYYIITDTNGNTQPVEGDYSSAIVVKVVGTVTGAMKGDAPSSEKKVADNNDTAKVQPDLSGIQAADWEDSADYDIGDFVPFKLKATTASNVDKYTKYHITFQDKQCAALGAPRNVSVSVLGKTIAVGGTATTTNGTKITVTAAAPDTGYTFAYTVTFEQAQPTTGTDGKITSYLNDECNSTDVIVTYESQLTDNGVKYGKEGNPNKMFIKYSNNPEDKDDRDEGKTPIDTVIVFTYRSTVDKVDEAGAPLKGANFALYKEVPSGTADAQLGSAIKANWDANVKAAAAALKDDKYYVLAGVKTGTSADTQFKFNGIDDGTYVLVETEIPTGYNAWASTEVTVSATHTSGQTPALVSLTATAPFSDNNLEAGTVKKTSGEYNRASGEAYAEIVNNSGATLPETGGMGTTLFYVIGSVLVIGAAVLLVTRRRVNAQ